MNTARFHKHVLELIRRTSTVLPPDVTEVIESPPRPRSRPAPRRTWLSPWCRRTSSWPSGLSAPICQDTGTITFYVKTPRGFDQLALEKVCKDAVAEATAKGYLRQN